MTNDFLKQQINHLLKKGLLAEDISSHLNLAADQMDVLKECVEGFSRSQQSLEGQHNQALYAMSLKPKAS